ncbi:MAG TPA: leucine-rich repeat protein [Bacilli bacterium]|nr:leucine-rich repeat protein [Bacilli bacterium]
MKYKGIIILLALIMMLSGCQNTEETTYQITFDTAGGNIIEPLTTKEFSDVTLPSPTRNGLQFIGWVDKLNVSMEPIFELSNVDKSIELLAKWQFTITYYNRFLEVIQTKEYVLGANSQLEEYIEESNELDFLGWFDQDGRLYQNTNTITSHISLYSAFEFTIDFVTNAIEDLEPVQVKLSEDIDLPIPIKAHYTFIGWYTDDALSKKVESTVELDSHTTLYAKWSLSAEYLSNLIFEAEGNELVLAGSIAPIDQVIVPSMVGEKKVIGIKDNAFINQNMITALIFEESSNIVYIGRSAFAATSITSLILPESLTTIKFGAFKGVSTLMEVSFPEYLEILEKEAFLSTGWYQQLRNTQFIINHILFFYKGSESSITIPSHVNQIYDYAFESNTSIKTIYFEENSNLQTISEFAFYGSRVETIHVPNSITTIENRAFENHLYIRNLHFGSGSNLLSIGEHAFEKSGLTTALFPSTVTSVGIDAFAQTPWLGEFESDFVVIGDILVRFKGHITTVTIPNTIRVIGPKAMAFNFVKHVIISNSVESIEKQAFVGTHLDSVTFEANSKLKYIGEEAFLNNYVKGDIAIPSSVELIADGAFNNCINLKSISFSTEQPPVIQSIFLPADEARIKIYVPAEYLTIYQTNINFSRYASIILSK